MASARIAAIRRQLALKGRFALRRALDGIRRTMHGRERLSLAQVQRRLELQLVAMYGRPISIESMAVSKRMADRVRRFVGRAGPADSVPMIDGATIRLPLTLAAPHGGAQALARYRLFAIEQAERIARGTPAHAPMHDPLERDLFLLREAAAIDGAIARAHPGMIETLRRERRLALERRPALVALTPSERRVELMLREALSQSPERIDLAAEPPIAAREWARTMAARLRENGSRYRGVPLAPLWGTLPPTTTEAVDVTLEEHKRTGPEVRSSIQLMSGPMGMLDMETRDARAAPSHARSGERDAEAGDPDAYASARPSREAGPHKQAGAAKQHDKQPAPGEAGNPGPGSVGTTHRAAGDDLPDDLPPAVYYDEWNSSRGSYVKRAVAVRLYEPREREDSDPAIVDHMLLLRDHGALVRQVRHQFERLRARRALLGRQRSGDDLDLTACVDARTDRRLGVAPDDRLYVASRPARRGLAIALLADTSGSTQTIVSDSTHVIDLERIALLLATEALDALGDLYAVYSFAGKSAEDVKLSTLKRFDQRNDRAVRRRIASIEAGGFTRLGAAVRHATRELARQAAGHRLLLILSDGRPNDIDAYQGTYGVEDSRQAIMEARASGVFPFCITVDANASEYLPRIFGTAGHVILQRPAQLPSALVAVVSALIRRG